MAQKPQALLAAVIGLVGTLLTVCGGLVGAIVSGGVTIYRVERQMQQVDVGSSQGGQQLTIDTGTIFISRQEAAALDPELYFVDMEEGWAIQRPLPGWGELEQLTVGEQMAEDDIEIPPSALADQPVYRMRYGQPLEIQSDAQTLANGEPMPTEMIEALEALYGPPPWNKEYYSQVIVNVFDKSIEEEIGVHNLAGLVMGTTRFLNARVNRLIAEEEATSSSYRPRRPMRGCRSPESRAPSPSRIGFFWPRQSRLTTWSRSAFCPNAGSRSRYGTISRHIWTRFASSTDPISGLASWREMGVWTRRRSPELFTLRSSDWSAPC